MDEVVEAARKAFAGHRWRQYYGDFVAFLDTAPTVNQRAGRLHGGFGWTMLQYICRFEMPGALALLLRVPGLDINYSSEDTCNYSPLCLAINADSCKCLRLLLEDTRIVMFISSMIRPRGRSPQLCMRWKCNNFLAFGVLSPIGRWRRT